MFVLTMIPVGAKRRARRPGAVADHQRHQNGGSAARTTAIAIGAMIAVVAMLLADADSER
jgi:hypothetical protein